MRGRHFSAGVAALLILSAIAPTAEIPVPSLTSAMSGTVPLPRRPGGLALPFIVNRGQTDPAVRFYTQASHGVVFVTGAGTLVYQVATGGPAAPAVAHHRLTEDLVGATVRHIDGRRKSPTTVNILHGRDSSRWQRGLETYEEVSLGEVYDGIAYHLRLSGRTVEKVFTVAPGASPSRIRLRLSSTEPLRVTPDGELEATTSAGAIRFTRPIAYQEADVGRREVDVAYAVANHEYGFRLGPYDPARPLVIDPSIVSTFLGGSAEDGITDMLLDGAGNLYVVGASGSADFPGITANSPDQTTSGAPTFDAFVAKLDADLSTVQTATFIGGGGDTAFEIAYAIARSATGEIYVGGVTPAADFPGVKPNAPDASYAGSSEAFIVRLDKDLTTFLSGTFVGGSDLDVVLDLAYDDNSSTLYAVGLSYSFDFPALSCPAAPDCLFQNGEGFAMATDSTLSTFTSGTWIGGSGGGVDLEQAQAVAVDPAGNVLVAGFTNSSDLAVITGADPIFEGDREGFIVKYAPGLTSVLATTFIGGAGTDRVVDMVVMVQGPSYVIVVAGTTCDLGLPGVSAASVDPIVGACSVDDDGFAATFDADLGAIFGATYLGGDDYERGMAIAAPAGLASEVYVAGFTLNCKFFLIDGGAADPFCKGDEGWVVKLDLTMTTLLGATYVGGANVDRANVLALNPAQGVGSAVYVAGGTESEKLMGAGVKSASAAKSGPTDGFISALPNDLAGPWLWIINVWKKFVLSVQWLNAEDQRNMIDWLTHIEEHGRAMRWDAAITETEELSRAVRRLAQSGALSREDARRMQEQARQLIAELRATERAEEESTTPSTRVALTGR